jgi:hypothetical protein
MFPLHQTDPKPHAPLQPLHESRNAEEQAELCVSELCVSRLWRLCRRCHPSTCLELCNSGGLPLAHLLLGSVLWCDRTGASSSAKSAGAAPGSMLHSLLLRGLGCQWVGLSCCWRRVPSCSQCLVVHGSPACRVAPTPCHSHRACTVRCTASM